VEDSNISETLHDLNSVLSGLNAVRSVLMERSVKDMEEVKELLSMCADRMRTIVANFKPPTSPPASSPTPLRDLGE
jgi:hypothetical protein